MVASLSSADRGDNYMPDGGWLGASQNSTGWFWDDESAIDLTLFADSFDGTSVGSGALYAWFQYGSGDMQLYLRSPSSTDDAEHPLCSKVTPQPHVGRAPKPVPELGLTGCELVGGHMPATHNSRGSAKKPLVRSQLSAFSEEASLPHRRCPSTHSSRSEHSIEMSIVDTRPGRYES